MHALQSMMRTDVAHIPGQPRPTQVLRATPRLQKHQPLSGDVVIKSMKPMDVARIQSQTPRPQVPRTTSRIQKHQLLPGDILLTHYDPGDLPLLELIRRQIVHEGQKLHLIPVRDGDAAPRGNLHIFERILQDVVYEGQKLHLMPGRGGDGDPDIVHAMLWTKADAEALESGDSCEITEAQFTKDNAATCAKLDWGRHTVIRARNREFAQGTAQVSRRWAKNKSVRYNPYKALRAPFGSIEFNDDAKRWAEHFRKDAHEENPRWGRSGTFCSQVIIAAGQATALDLNIALPAALRAHAAYVTPRVLHGLLKNDPESFYEVGEIAFEHNESHAALGPASQAILPKARLKRLGEAKSAQAAAV